MRCIKRIRKGNEAALNPAEYTVLSTARKFDISIAFSRRKWMALSRLDTVVGVIRHQFDFRSAVQKANCRSQTNLVI